ncbi:allantoinase AllB [Aridibaculum aurantiacum]|uniref:allantoinase AllB n=1 Tax=Aridibaculum aurantiacum TaxID=2810307 RepID=UPI001A960923|nr:allantoinase AllB [Aridibaculum aurantiacum]
MRKGIYSKRCWTGGRLQEATVCFNNGKIEEIISGAMPAGEITDAGDHILMPGIIDAHVHVNEPGRTDWEGFDTATKAAAAGGITTIVDMPLNASPVTTTLAAFHEKLEATKGKLHVNCGFYAGLVPGNVHELEGMINAGVLGVKAFLTHSGIDEFPNVGIQELEEAMPLLAKHKVPLLVHCELSDDKHGDDLAANPTSYQSYLNSRPRHWENYSIKMMIDLCRKHNCPTHIVHVSSSDALAMIASAKAEGLPLTAESCPQYLYFNAEEIPDGNTLYKCAPPIRERENNEQLKQALKNRILDFITTDHSPAPPSIKEIASGNLLEAWGGIAGLQFLLPSSWTALKQQITLEEFIPLVTEQPAKFLSANNNKGLIKEGYDADLTIWSPAEQLVITEEQVYHKHKLSPYIGKELYGKTYATYVAGELVYKDQNIINKNKGQWLLRK